MADNKILIYQVFPRLFGNRNMTRKQHGTIAENGCGKMNNFTSDVLRRIHDMGITHIWFTGIIRHSTQTDYTSYGIPHQHPAIVKGKAGSPYAIVDYYDVDPDLAEDVAERMNELEALILRTHKAGMKVILDFVPNHVAREYHSITKPQNTTDLGEHDDIGMRFSPQNNFYYCVNEPFAPSVPLSINGEDPYVEIPAKATGNDRFDNHPCANDWYETVKLNYGIDYCDAGGRSEHFSPMPATWQQMTDILLFWASKGVDAFRCDMAEMVPPPFWEYATTRVKESFVDTLFIGEVYDPKQYRTYLHSGFDYLYDKVGMYDYLSDVVRQKRPASSITQQWQFTDDINHHMLYFLENHDELRIASDFFCGTPQKALPAVIVSLMLRTNPFMLYAGQEVGERGMDEEGFSGSNGRTTIFDYWALPTLNYAYTDRRRLSPEMRSLQDLYKKLMLLANDEKAIREGDFFDLMYANPASEHFMPEHLYTFLRKKDEDIILVIVNFSEKSISCSIHIPQHAFDCLNMAEQNVMAEDLVSNETFYTRLSSSTPITVTTQPYSGKIYKIRSI